MKIVAECPGMCSDRREITPKVLLLESSFHVLERERDGYGGLCGRFGGGEKATSKYKSSQADPTFCAGANRPRPPGGPSHL